MKSVYSIYRLFKRYRRPDKSKNNFSFTIGNQQLFYLNQPDASFYVEKYTPAHKNAWDQFVRNSKNATFLFLRDFMEYHSDRFEDGSLLVLKGKKVVALLPANRVGAVVHSHQGLSYGGLVLSSKIKMNETLLVFKTVLTFLEQDNVTTLSIKLLPKIYHSLPADEIDYILFLLQATRTRVDVSATIENRNALAIQGNRMEGVKKAERQGLSILESEDFGLFWNEILVPNLAARHDAKPVHSLEEISLLASRFSKQIRQFNVMHDGLIVAGTTLFVTKNVVHVQYISANKDKQQLGSLDFLFHHLINEKFADKKYFDFGVSNENKGKNINGGLQYWKECFGARAISHEFYEVATANHMLLDSVFI
ncbi:GNAT family N-acetyltransferase [Rasiella rasia]|uniref:GNAT family N-acetyltransferase n=1 Tax=Rasiella rasia TaxID=2744027 RepID=A0A6G6GKI1_9FLAO|nr:GNAT family N-acetyltransferase [Rasiella rasia]